MNEGWRGFVELCLSAEHKQELAGLLTLFLTPEEKNSLSTRYLIVRELLLKNKTQREIAQALGVSISKITRGSNELKRLKPSFKMFLEKKLLIKRNKTIKK